MFKKMGIARKLFFGFGILVVFVVVVSLGSIVMTQNIVKNFDEIIKTQVPIANAAMETNIIMMDLMFNTSAYVLSGNRDYIEQQKASKAQFEESRKVTTEKLSGYREELDIFNKEIYPGMTEIMKLSDEAIGAYGTKDFKEVLQRTLSGAGKINDELEARLEQIEYSTESKIKDNYTLANRTFSAAIFMVAISVIVISALAVLIGWLVTRSITKPVGEVVESLTGGAAQVTSASEQVASASQELAQGASEQASSLEETSSSLEEMASMINLNSDNARQANVITAEAESVAKDGLQSMENMTRSVQRIKVSSDQTAKIIKTIDEIAFQTNLLALNAAVEAARAGEAGKGFAVVAEEVRNLAKRAAEAAKSTNDLIADVQKNVESGVSANMEMMNKLRNMSEKINKVSGLSGEVAASSQEQAKGISQITAAVAEMDKVTQSNSASAEESASASEEMSGQAIEMKEMVEKLKGVVYGETASDVKRTLATSNVPIKKATAIKKEIRVQHMNTAVRPGVKAQQQARKPSPQSIIPLDASDVKEF